MIFKNIPLAGTASLLALVSFVGCDTRSPEQAGQAPSSVTASAATTDEKGAWQCPASPGTAPSGQLTAERIPGSASKREQAGLYEGPVWIDGALYFSDFTFEEGFPSRVQRLTAEGTLETAIEDSGSNGLAVDSEGFLMAATHDAKAISRYELSTGERELIWNEFEGNPFNSPNDLTLTEDGVIYFTDPAFQRAAAPGGQPQTRVYRIAESGISVVEADIRNPNGISLSPDEKTLYVAGGGENGVLRAYSLTASGTVESHRDLAKIEIPDGMAIDCLGNIYVTEHALQRVRVFTPEGEEIAQIQVDANITNAAFGGPERKTLYLTGAGTLWQISLEVAGFPY
ncbi:SMP-30/gluconolactonase/LRE family protein [Marinimicrobium agarilyticum]|uniref:SMP-30/gluconolactonase/LRE family protein n=1 Tax=Marinimicrobium agarilyticum TaxID=306546 RepID=UPI00041E7B8F|nr:SMP-30/gluconolactonase/LRE family protein [Marinimicrobium agarilyticum]